MEFTSIEALREDIAKITEQVNHLERTKGVLEQALAMLLQSAHASKPDPPVLESSVSPVPRGMWHAEVIGTEPTPSSSEVEKAKETVEEFREGLNSIKESLSAPPSSEEPKQRYGRRKITTSMLRDAVIELRGQKFTAQDLADKVGASRSGIHPKLMELVRQEIVVNAGERRRGRTGRGSVLFIYNENIPAGPTEHPRATPPEKELIGATPPRGVPMGAGQMSNGRIFVQDSMIQGFINCAYQQDWTVEWKTAGSQGGSHLKFKSPTGVTVGVNAKPPNKKVGLVIKRDLKRAGLKLA